jgi:hypothetical protein
MFGNEDALLLCYWKIYAQLTQLVDGSWSWQKIPIVCKLVCGLFADEYVANDHFCLFQVSVAAVVSAFS